MPDQWMVPRSSMEPSLDSLSRSLVDEDESSKIALNVINNIEEFRY